jgi:hypothetical protein
VPNHGGQKRDNDDGGDQNGEFHVPILFQNRPPRLTVFAILGPCAARFNVLRRTSVGRAGPATSGDFWRPPELLLRPVFRRTIRLTLSSPVATRAGGRQTKPAPRSSRRYSRSQGAAYSASELPD